MDDYSWRLKIGRAREHLAELDVLLRPFWDRRDYLVTESENKHHKQRQWIYHLSCPAVVDPKISLVLGDALFNLRSALDHIAVALVPRRRKFSASYPICLKDPEAVGANRTTAGEREFAAWKTATMGMNASVLTIVRKSQPYSAVLALDLQPPDLAASDHSLAVLSALQNADKHRQLIIAIEALDLQSVEVRDRVTGDLLFDDVERLRSHLHRQGAVIHAGPTQVDVKAIGALHVAVGVGGGQNWIGPYRRLPDFPEALLRTVEGLVGSLEIHL